MPTPRLPSFFKSKQPRSFDFEKRFYNKKQEILDEKIKHSVKTNSFEFKSRERKNHNRQFSIRIVFIALLILGILYLVFENL